MNRENGTIDIIFRNTIYTIFLISLLMKALTSGNNLY